MKKPSFLDSLVSEPTVKIAADKKFDEIKGLSARKELKDKAEALRKIASLSNTDYEVMSADQINFIEKIAADTAALDGVTEDSSQTEITDVGDGTSDTDQQGNLQGAAQDDASTAGDLLDGEDKPKDAGPAGEQGDSTAQPSGGPKANKTDAPDATAAVEEVILDAVKSAAVLAGIEEYFQEVVGVIQKKASLRLQQKVAMQKKIASIRKQFGDDIARDVVKIASQMGLFD